MTGLTKAGADQFAKVAADYVSDQDTPGIVAVMSSGADVQAVAAGKVSIGGSPMRRDTLFRIASLTKSMTSAAAMTLVEEGRLDLDEPVGKLLPELAEPRVLRRPDGPVGDTVPAQRPITARDILSFTFGFGGTAEMFDGPHPWPIAAASNEQKLFTLSKPDPDQTPEPDTWMARLGSLPLVMQPGTQWLYNTGATLAGVLVARASGAPLPRLLRERVFEPLGMADTAFWAQDTARLATAYSRTRSGLQAWDPPDGKWSREPAFPDGGAGLVSTADDILAFSKMMLRGGSPVLSAASVAEMTRDQLIESQKAQGVQHFLKGRGWGFGVAVETTGPHRGAFGWNGGYGTSWHADPARDLTVIVLTQRSSDRVAIPQPVHGALQEAAYGALA